VLAALVTTAALAALAVPSFGLDTESSSAAPIAIAASTQDEPPAAAAEESNATAAASVQSFGAFDGAPFPVATVTVTLVDPTRSTPARGSTAASSSRTLTLTISYPVTETATQFPLVVFIHGFDVDAATYLDLEQEIAAAGFVVAAPDFPVSSSALSGSAARDIVEQATDVSFVITELLDASSVPTELSGRIEDTKVAVVGHSDGAVTAAGVAFNGAAADSRVGAAVLLSGAEAFFPGTWFGDEDTPAMLAVHGTDDEINPFAESEELFADATGPKWLVAVTDGSHLAPFTTDPVRAGVAVLVATFLRAELEGDVSAFAAINSAANAPGLALVAAA